MRGWEGMRLAVLRVCLLGWLGLGVVLAGGGRPEAALAGFLMDQATDDCRAGKPFLPGQGL